ncbi:nuclear transport factor 2 family protein [Cupriavidus sp. TMH.W2]|uniref:nuclear transport factor 2 family protein n=1 Tax=Cupriavidus sp. TMH.W2 TaxID=3434465 RepID=UPI003D7822DF
MSYSALEIANLLYRYAELMDSGDLSGVAALFRNAKLKSAGSDVLRDEVSMLDQWRRHVRIYPCGTPRTKHVITNPIIEIDEAAGRARCRSYYTVLQATDTLPLQVVAAGRYHDEFEQTDGRWHFSYRDYSLFDLQGDLSQHLNLPAPAGGRVEAI